MPHIHAAQQEGPVLLIIARGASRPVDDLTDAELVTLAQSLSDQLGTVSALIAWRHAAPSDAELCAMADYYEELERGRFEIESDALDREACHA
jgi:hypothetical protein